VAFLDHIPNLYSDIDFMLCDGIITRCSGEIIGVMENKLHNSKLKLKPRSLGHPGPSSSGPTKAKEIFSLSVSVDDLPLGTWLREYLP
jgi:hypothetical protein